MIVLGRVVPLKSAAEYDFSGIAESRLNSRTAMLMIGPSNPTDGEGCCDFGFSHNADQYILGYNSVTLISNFRNLLDAFKDLALYIMLSLILRENQPQPLLLLYPIYIGECLMFFDILTLRRNELAENLDVLIALMSAAWGVVILTYLRSANMYPWIIAKLSFTVVSFLYVRLIQRRFNKNVGVNLLKIGMEVQLLLLWKEASTPASWVFKISDFIPLLILGGILSIISAFHVIVILKKILTPVQALKMLNVTDFAVLISWLYGPLVLLLLLSFQKCNVLLPPATRAQSDLKYCDYRNSSGSALAILAAVRLLLVVPMNRFVNKMAKVNEANNLGTDGTFTILYGLFRKDYLSF